MLEGIPVLNFMVPKSFEHEDGRRTLAPTGESGVLVPSDEVLVAVGQENAFPWIERDLGLEFDRHGLPVLDPKTMQSTLQRVFFGGDAAFGPKNIITAVAQGHEAAVSIDKFLQGENLAERPAPHLNLVSQKMGIHEWSYDNDVSQSARQAVPWASADKALKSIKVEVELGFDAAAAFREAQRCLNCDVQTVFAKSLCIECDACVDIFPMDSITFTMNGDEADLRTRLKAPAENTAKALYVSEPPRTSRVMVKDEDVFLPCGLCAERCPTGAWDMQKFLIEMTCAGPGCRSPRRRRSPSERRRDHRLPDSCGAPFTARRSARSCAYEFRVKSITAVNDFVVKFANVNGSGSASANELFAKAIQRMGVPVSPAQHLPLEHPGAPDLVRGAGQ
jgi:formate dehydrogenase beta subunit